MKRIFCIFFLFPLLCATSNAQSLPTAETVLAQYIKAIGGKRALTKIKDLTIEETSIIGNNNLTMVYKYKSPEKSVLRVVHTQNGTEISSHMTEGNKEIVKSPFGRYEVEEPLASSMRISRIKFYEFHFPKLGVKSTLEGVEEVNGKSAYKLKHSTVNGASWTSHYDTETGLKVKSDMEFFVQNKPEQLSELYEDYREVNGIKISHIRKATSPSFTSEWKVQSVIVNAKLPDSEFIAR
ncbi:MAG: hypothetical protein KKG00_12090 [Bacteroidetes bacterium]|nr:hypothetical protein [Bacteroidota bacterium]